MGAVTHRNQERIPSGPSAVGVSLSSMLKTVLRAVSSGFHGKLSVQRVFRNLRVMSIELIWGERRKGTIIPGSTLC